jgi:hypothetical protein
MRRSIPVGRLIFSLAERHLIHIVLNSVSGHLLPDEPLGLFRFQPIAGNLGSVP